MGGTLYSWNFAHEMGVMVPSGSTVPMDFRYIHGYGCPTGAMQQILVCDRLTPSPAEAIRHGGYYT